MENSQAVEYEQLRLRDVLEVRRAVRTGQYQSHTAGLAPGKLQANLAILPWEYALDFMRFCQRNPKPCPLVGVTETGDPMFRTLGADIDVRTDIPDYNIYRDGVLTESCTDISEFWTDDLVAFAIGCSFTFERAFMAAGIPVWHIENNKTVPMYRSSLQTATAGPFGGEMVVTMRGTHPDQVDQAARISGRFHWAHGAPVHIGDPEAIGITDLGRPDWGDVPPPLDEKTPVFWACGVTPQNAIMRAKLPLCITHKPGHMLITDVDEQAEVPIIST